MGFWEQATDQAGREFGARHWRWFAAARAARRLAPALAVVVIAVALLIAYRLVSPDWGAVGSSVAGWAPTVGLWAVLAVVGAVLGYAMVRIGLALWRAHSWRFSRY
jgi:hypothetical protein